MNEKKVIEMFRVIRGGSWGYADPRRFRTAYRVWFAPGYRIDFLGFRLALRKSK